MQASFTSISQPMTETFKGAVGDDATSKVTLTLPAALYGFVGLGAILFALTATTLVSRQVELFQHRALEEAVQVRTRGAADVFGRALDRDWSFLNSFRRTIPIGDPESLQTALNVLTGDGKRIAWAGYAGIDGTVVSASHGLLEGLDVSARPWFQRGLSGPYAGDVHEAVLLNDALGGTEDDPLSFLDLSAPVSGPDGRTAGVVGFHINSNWAHGFFAETAESLEVDFFLVGSDGSVVTATDEVGTVLDLPSIRSATAGVQTSGFETWPDGQSYFTTVVPQISHGSLPPFGWRLVGRIDSTQMSLAGEALKPTIVAAVAGAGIVLMLLTMIFARLFLSPIAALARTADRMADGHDEYPVEMRRTSELASMSSALARLQGRRG